MNYLFAKKTSTNVLSFLYTSNILSSNSRFNSQHVHTISLHNIHQFRLLSSSSKLFAKMWIYITNGESWQTKKGDLLFVSFSFFLPAGQPSIGWQEKGGKNILLNQLIVEGKFMQSALKRFICWYSFFLTFSIIFFIALQLNYHLLYTLFPLPKKKLLILMSSSSSSCHHQILFTCNNIIKLAAIHICLAIDL